MTDHGGSENTGPAGSGQAELAPAPVAPVRRRRTVFAAAPGLVLVVLGVVILTGFVALLALDGIVRGFSGGGSGLEGFEGFENVGLMVGVGFAYGLTHIVGGIAVVMGRGWGRAIGVVVAVASLAMGLAGLPRAAAQDGLGVAVIWLGAYLYVALALLFRWKMPAT